MMCIFSKAGNVVCEPEKRNFFPGVSIEGRQAGKQDRTAARPRLARPVCGSVFFFLGRDVDHDFLHFTA